MNTSQVISSDQIRKISTERIGLVLGQEFSTRSNQSSIIRDLTALALSECTLTLIHEQLQNTSFADALDLFANSDPDGYDSFRKKAAEYASKSVQGNHISKLAQISWAAVISLCLDPNIEIAIRNHLTTKPTQRKVITVTTPTVLDRPALLLPVYKLLGNCFDDTESERLVFSTTEYKLRTPEWRMQLANISGFLREGGLIFLGTSNSLNYTLDLLSAIYAGRPPYPNYLIFKESDPASENLQIIRMANKRSVIYKIKDSEEKIISSLLNPTSPQLNFQFPTATSSGDERSELLQFKNIVSQLPLKKPTYQLATRKQQVVDELFRPNERYWDAYLFDLELPRTVVSFAHNTIKRVNDIPEKRPKFIVMRGEAGVGKTIVAKRLAINLRKEGGLVLWANRTHGEFFHQFRELAKELKKIQSKDINAKLFMFWDDPWALGLSPVEIATALDHETVDITIIVITRNSDRAIARGISRLPPIDDEIEIDFELTDKEEGDLPSFLQRIGAAKNLEDAKHILSCYSGQNARDILCRLWYLLPQTRAQLEKSLSDEYFRLEGIDRLVENLAESAATSSLSARRAYEYVAVTSGLDIGIPDEILVNALQINYSEWLEICADGRPLWGLLYPVQHATSDQYLYFTRNEIVTQTLLRQINGGIGHAGEVRILKTLIAACTGSGPVYRDFLVDLLVRNKDKIKKIVTPAEGRELYELALNSFPAPDRTLVHHYAKWIGDEVHDNKIAYEILERALDTLEYPYAQTEERREYIHTSMAAVVVQRVKRGEQDRESGLLAIKRHLREASTPTFFNLFTVHVQVNALTKLQQGDDPVSLDCFIEACRAIERGQQLAGANGRRQIRNREALELLENQKKELSQSLAPFSSLAEDALSRYQNDGNQLVLEAAVLKGLIESSFTNKGSDYNDVHQFILRCQDRVHKKKQHISAGLRQAKIDLVVRWRLQNDSGEVDWNIFLGDVRTVREEPAKRDDILLLFYEGVACFHLRLIDDSLAAFSRLRSLQIPAGLMSHKRIWLRGKSGKPEQVQCTLSKKGTIVRARLADYQYDSMVFRDKAPAGIQDGAITHCFLGFTLQGPIAIFDQPTSAELMLPT